jgi:hypothetical protein
MPRLKSLEEENRELREQVSKLTLDNAWYAQRHAETVEAAHKTAIFLIEEYAVGRDMDEEAWPVYRLLQRVLFPSDDTKALPDMNPVDRGG